MAQEVDEYILEITANNQDAVKKIEEVTKQTEKLGSKSVGVFESLKKNWLALTGAVIAYVAVGKKLVDGYIDQEKEDIRLTAALKAQGKEVVSNTKAMKKLASQLQDTAGIADGTAQDMISLALNMGVGTDEMDKTIKSAIGLSKAFGIDTTQALKLTQQAAQGNTQRMHRMIPALENANTEGERMAIINKAIASGWQATTNEVNTAGGQFNQLRLKLEQVFDVMGELIAKALLPMVKFVSDIITKFLELDPIWQKVISGAGILTVTLFGVAGAIKAIGLASAFLNLNPVMLSITGASLAIAGIIKLISNARTQTRLLRGEARQGDQEALKSEINKQQKILDARKKLVDEIKNSIENLDKFDSYYNQRLIEENKTLEARTKAFEEQRIVVNNLAKDLKTLEKDDLPVSATGTGTGGGVGSGGSFKKEAIEAQQLAIQKLEIEKAYLEERGRMYEAKQIEKDIASETEILKFLNDEVTKTGITEVELAERLRLEQEAQAKKKAMAVEGYTTLKDILGQASGLMSSESKSQFQIGKASAIASAIMSTAEGIMKTFGTFGFPLGLPFATALGALGAVQIGNIASQQFNPPKAAKGGIFDSKTIAMVGERGPEMVLPAPITKFIRDSVGMGANGGGGMTQVFNISGKVIDKLALKEFSKEIFRETEAWQSRNEAY